MVTRYLDGAHPKIMGWYWTGQAGLRALEYHRARNTASDDPQKSHYQFVLGNRGRR